MKELSSINNSTIVIGITGGIGSGKSVVSRILRCNGWEVYDTDSEAKRILVEDSEVKKAIVGLLGKKSYSENGYLNRKWISERIFSDKALREGMNEIVHCKVVEDIIRKIKKANFIIFIESALLVSSGIQDFCDYIWLIETPLEERIERISKRDGLKKIDVMKRIESQNKELENLILSKTEIIVNSDEKSLLNCIINKIENLKIRKYA